MSDLLIRLHELMKKEGIKPTQLAKELGMSSSAFTDWGKGKGSPSLKAVMQFSEHFNVSIDYLVYGTEHAENNKLEFSNPEDIELLEKFHLLTPELRSKAVGYIEGMLSALPSSQAPNAEQKLYG